MLEGQQFLCEMISNICIVDIVIILLPYGAKSQEEAMVSHGKKSRCDPSDTTQSADDHVALPIAQERLRQAEIAVKPMRNGPAYPSDVGPSCTFSTRII